MYISSSSCEKCGNTMTIEEEIKYQDLCEKCCSFAWKKYEIAMSGVCRVDTKRFPISKKLRDYIFQRDKVCLACGSDSDLTIDHITPVSCGGSNHHSNLQVMCRKCNSIKGSYPQDYREVIE